jgi:hypothetical protein
MSFNLFSTQIATIKLKVMWSYQTKVFPRMLQHPVLMALLTIAVAMVGYGIARGIRYYVKCQREALLEPPVDLLQGCKEYIASLVVLFYS